MNGALPPRPIAAVGVGIPARDEAGSIGACLRAVAAAARAVEVPVAVVVVADACTDGTAEGAEAVLAAEPDLDGAVLVSRWRRAGAARARALDVALARAGVDPAAVWLATTDADTVVAPGWLAAQLRWAARGWDAVAGLVDVDWAGAPPWLPDRHRAAVASGGTAVGHAHVHGANLGLRGSWWRHVGGCGDGATGEDHELWHRLRVAGARTLGVDDLGATTSGRLQGRAPAGFAGHLRRLLAVAPAPVPVVPGGTVPAPLGGGA